jgi:hypothetical protein
LTMPSHIIHYKSTLTFIRSNNTNLFGSYSSIKESRYHLFDIFTFFSIQKWCARCWDFFAADGMVEEHGLICLWPHKLKSIQNPVLLWNSILKTTFIKRERWEIT